VNSHYNQGRPYADILQGIAAIKRMPSNVTAGCGQCIEDYTGYLAVCDVVMSAFAELQATLTVMLAQTEAEEAGQRRLVDDALDAVLDTLSE
jgi:hypothetical protein